MTIAGSIASLAACLSLAASGQSFEVAAIKPHVGLVASIGLSTSGNRVTAAAMSVSNLVQYAYDLKGYDISGGPEWVRSDRWDIFAKGDAEGPLTRDQVRAMLRSLLADRFRVRLHRESRGMAVYALVPGKGGPKLTESAPDATSMLRLRGGRAIRITTTKGSMEQLVAQLSSNLDRPVLDKTNLTGQYDYKLEWAPDSVAAENPDVPAIFAAVREQLGLKLEPAREEIEVIVIDSVNRPSEN